MESKKSDETVKCEICGGGLDDGDISHIEYNGRMYKDICMNCYNKICEE